jgi:hypothetical protein
MGGSGTWEREKAAVMSVKHSGQATNVLKTVLDDLDGTQIIPRTRHFVKREILVIAHKWPGI